MPGLRVYLLFACALVKLPSTQSSIDAHYLGAFSRLLLHVSLEHAGEGWGGEDCARLALSFDGQETSYMSKENYCMYPSNWRRRASASSSLSADICKRGTSDGSTLCACVKQRILMRLRGAGDRQQEAALREGESDSEAEEIFRPRVLEDGLGADSLDMRARDSVLFESSLRAEQGVEQVCMLKELDIDSAYRILYTRSDSLHMSRRRTRRGRFL
jgi:hypothetical protein